MSRTATPSGQASVTGKESLDHIMLDLRQMKSFVANPLVMARADGVWYEDIHGKR